MLNTTQRAGMFLFPLRSCLFYSFRYSLMEAVDLKEKGKLFQRSGRFKSEGLVWLNLQVLGSDSRVVCYLTAQNTMPGRLFQFITLNCFSSFFIFIFLVSHTVEKYAYMFISSQMTWEISVTVLFRWDSYSILFWWLFFWSIHFILFLHYLNSTLPVIM